MSPSARDWRLYADDISESCGKVRRYVAWNASHPRAWIGVNWRHGHGILLPNLASRRSTASQAPSS